MRPLARRYSSNDPCQSRWSGATLRHAAATADTERCQCSWKLDSSTAMTSNGSGCSTASRIGVPTLPALVARSPAARRIDASMFTVVVLPLVPVTVSQGAAPVFARIRQASSTSPQTGMPRAAASSSIGWVRPPPRGGDDEVDVLGRHAGGVLLTLADGDAEDVEDVGPLVVGPRLPCRL